MTKERTEEEKLCKAPIKVVLGGKDYEVPPLVIKDSRAWRAKVSEALGGIPDFMAVTSDDPAAFKTAMDGMLVKMPNTVAELFFSYATGLDREAIEAVATDTELATAFEEVAAMAFPLISSLVGIMGKVAPQA